MQDGRLSALWLGFSPQDWAKALAIGAVFGFLIAAFGAQSSGTLTAALVALVIALYVYPWQKNSDRDLELRRERRAIFHEYIENMQDCVGAVYNRQFEEYAEAMKVARNSFDGLVLYSEPQVIRAARLYFEALHEWGQLLDADIREGRPIGSFSQEAEASYRSLTRRKAEMVLMMRADVLSEPTDQAALSVSEMYMQVNLAGK